MFLIFAIPLFASLCSLGFFIYSTVKHGFKLVVFIAALNIILLSLYELTQIMLAFGQGYNPNGNGGSVPESTLAEKLFWPFLFFTIIASVLAVLEVAGRFSIGIALIPFVILTYLLGTLYATWLSKENASAKRAEVELQALTAEVDVLTRDFIPTKEPFGALSFLTIETASNEIVLVKYIQEEEFKKLLETERIGKIAGQTLSLYSKSYALDPFDHELLATYKNSKGESVFDVYTIDLKDSTSTVDQSNVKDYLY